MSIFSKIVRREIPSEIVYEDEQCFAIKDIHPQAPVHLLVIPKKEIVSLLTVEKEDAALLGHLLWVVHEIAKKQHLARGYRVIINCGPEGGQTVDHLHLHLLGGRSLDEAML